MIKNKGETIMKQRIDYIVAHMIYERKFDVPEWTYDFVNQYVLLELIELEPKHIIDRYINEPNVRNFFNRIYGKVKFSPFFLSCIITGVHYDYMMLLSGRWDFIRLRLSIKNYKLIFLDILFKYGIKSDEFISKMQDIIHWLHIPKIFIAHFADAKIKTLLLDETIDEVLQYQRYMERLVKILDADKSIELTEYFLSLGVPVFFQYGDEVDVHRYLTTIIQSKWQLSLNRHIINIDYKNRDELIYLLTQIGQQQNLEGLVLLSEICGNSLFLGSDLRNIFFTPKYKQSITSLTDFQDVIKIFGHQENGLPMEVQSFFLINGGDVRTMFDNNKLLPEATIIKTPNMTLGLITILPVDQIRFLLYNSVDFVQDIFGCTLTYSHMIKILEALFEVPFNEELYKTLNDTKNYRVDYRTSLVQHLTTYLSWDYIYQQLPQAMLYHEPSLFYITRHIDEANVSYIPAERILPYISTIIARSNYTKFNLYCKGSYISLDKIVGNKKELYKNMVTYKKFGYIGDLLTDNPKELLETICKYYIEE